MLRILESSGVWSEPRARSGAWMPGYGSELEGARFWMLPGAERNVFAWERRKNFASEYFFGFEQMKFLPRPKILAISSAVLFFAPRFSCDNTNSTKSGDKTIDEAELFWSRVRAFKKEIPKSVLISACWASEVLEDIAVWFLGVILVVDNYLILVANVLKNNINNINE